METTLTHKEPIHDRYLLFDLINTPLSGHNLIEASAGTGKTFTITRLVVRFLLEQELPISSILVVTFTEAASSELRERIYNLIKQSITDFNAGTSDDPLLMKLIRTIPKEKALSLLNNALYGFDNSSIFTIHGFCKKVLTDHSFECNATFDATLITDQSELVKEILLDFWRINFYKCSQLFASFAISSGITPDTFLQIFNKVKNHTDIKRIPVFTQVDTSIEEKRFTAQCKALQEEWNNCKDTVIQLLKSKSLKATKYKDTTIKKMISQMNDFSVSEVINPLLFDTFENFTTSVLTSFTKKGEIAISHRFFDSCEDLQNTSSNLCKQLEIILNNLKNQSIDYIKDELKKRKNQKNVLYFDDLLHIVKDGLANSLSGQKLVTILSNKYKAALIDEFQDTDPIQYAIFKKIFSSRNTVSFLIGDPKQAIYSFRGADIFTYLIAAQEVTNRYSLDTNYRSTPGLVSAVSYLFSKSSNPFLFEDIRFKESQSINENEQHIVINGVKQKEFTILFKKNDENEVTVQPTSILVAQKIAQMISAGQNSEGFIGTNPLNPRHFAILVRTNDEANEYQNALSQYSIPSVIDSNRSVFKTVEAQELYYLLSAIADPSDNRLINSALVLPFFRLSNKEIEACILNIDKYNTYIEQFFHFHDLWQRNGFEYMIRSVFDQLHLKEKILELPQGERKLTNYLHLAELIEREVSNGVHGSNSLLSWMTEKIYGESASISDEDVIRLESDADSITILTLHKSKGLEFDIVFCPSIATTGSESKREIAYVCHDNNKPLIVLGKDEKDQYKPQFESEILAENLRLFYVALTRAKTACYLIYEKTDSAATSAFSYLLFGNDVAFPYVASLKQKVKSLSDEEIWNQIKKLGEIHQSIGTSVLEENKQAPLVKTVTTSSDLSCRIKNFPIPSSWKIASYTYLTHSQAPEDAKIDELSLDKEVSSQIIQPTKDEFLFNILNFPKGAKTGVLLHSILEYVDLSSQLENPKYQEFIQNQLMLYGFDPNWLQIIIDLLHTLSKIELRSDADNMLLSQIKQDSFIKELEFSFPLNEIDPTAITNAFSQQINLFGEEYSGEHLHFSSVCGYLKGFVDMIFQYKEKFYIIDWKSNHLGLSFEDYGPENLNKVMISEHYTLQYYLYTIAMDLYLKKHLSDYSFDKNFGGIFYIFLRGVSENKQTGIYYRKPEKKILSSLATNMIRVNLA